MPFHRIPHELAGASAEAARTLQPRDGELATFTMLLMEIDYLLLAEHAEVTGSKLYLMGGGWDTMSVPEAPASVRINLAAGVRVEWDETNLPVPLLVRVDDDDAQEVFRLEGQMNVGRPPHLPAGTSQLSQMTFALSLKLPRFGGYRVSLSAGREGAVRRSIPFRLAQVTR